MAGLVVKCACQHCERVTVVPRATVQAILSTISDDESVEEAQRRVNQGQWSPSKLG